MTETTDKPDLTVAEIAARHKPSRQTVTKLFGKRVRHHRD
jgi:hypothetical protein